MSHIVGWSQAAATDAFYLEDDRPGVGGGTSCLLGAWPVDHFTGDSAVLVGDLVSVTVVLWIRSGTAEPDIRLGHFAAGSPPVWVDDSGAWTPLAAQSFGQFWARTWFRRADAALVDYGFVDVALLEPPLELSRAGHPHGGLDGGQVWGLCWRDTPTLENAYGLLSSGTDHVPPTTNVEVANFYVGTAGDGLVASPDPGTLPSTDAPVSDAHEAIVLDDNTTVTGLEEYFGLAFYQPAQGATSVGQYTTSTPQGAMIFGVGPPAALSTILAAASAGGIVRQKSIIGG